MINKLINFDSGAGTASNAAVLLRTEEEILQELNRSAQLSDDEEEDLFSNTGSARSLTNRVLLEQPGNNRWRTTWRYMQYHLFQT
jgi:hypothetical protein